MAPDCVSQYVAEHVTIVLTTHPVPSNPSPRLVCSVFQSYHLSDQLRNCAKVLVFDAPSERAPMDKTQAPPPTPPFFRGGEPGGGGGGVTGGYVENLDRGS